jgi:hypothetical protein
MGLTPEGKVKLAVKAVLKDLRAWWYMPVQNGMGVVGIPDFIVCLAGRFVAIETKAPGKEATVTPNQMRQLNGIATAEGTALVIATTDRADIKARIESALA